LLRSAGSGKPYPRIKIALSHLAGPQAIRRVRPAALGQAGEVGPVVAFPEGLASAEARLAREPAAFTIHRADQSAHRVAGVKRMSQARAGQELFARDFLLDEFDTDGSDPPVGMADQKPGAADLARTVLALAACQEKERSDKNGQSHRASQSFQAGRAFGGTPIRRWQSQSRCAVLRSVHSTPHLGHSEPRNDN